MSKPIVVMKFGGTSVATKEGRDAIALRIKTHQDLGKTCVVVVSAMGRKGAPYATDTLLSLVDNLPTTPHEIDALQSVGEIISSVFIASELRSKDIKARAFSGASAGIFAQGDACAGKVQEVHLAKLVESVAKGETPIVAGFQALSETGELITLGRGGSDTSACVLGVALGAEAVEIYSDVDGILSADPRIVADAQPLEVIRADELFQLASMGSRIIHAPAAELALTANVPLFLRNTYTDYEGTRVVDIASYRPLTLATAVTSNANIVRFCVDLGSKEGCKNHLEAQTEIYEHLAASKISLDMFTPAGEQLFFTVADTQCKQVREVLTTLSKNYECNEGLSKVTVVGAGMHGVPGVMARIASALCPHGIDIFQTADSHNTISVVVKTERSAEAQNALHAAFDLGGDGIKTVEALHA